MRLRVFLIGSAILAVGLAGCGDDDGGCRVGYFECADGVECVDNSLTCDGTAIGPVCVQDEQPGVEGPYTSPTCSDGLDNDGDGQIDLEDEVAAGTLLCRDGEVVHPRVRELLGLAALPASN